MRLFNLQRLSDHDKRYATNSYRIERGKHGNPILQIWIEYPNRPMSKWKNVHFDDAHTLLEGKHK